MSTSMSSQSDQEPTTLQAIELFKSIQTKFESTAALGSDKWYLLTLASIINTYPELAATLYKYILTLPTHQTSETRIDLLRRLREALLKSVSILGVCKPLESIFALTGVTSPEDADASFSRQHWKSGPENIARGKSYFDKIYLAKNQAGTGEKLDQHKDFKFLTEEITYGFYLSDLSILDEMETEIVVLSAISIQNLKLETAWHLRGIRRVGVEKKDVEIIQDCIELVARFSGTRTNRLPKIADVEHEVDNDRLD